MRNKKVFFVIIVILLVGIVTFIQFNPFSSVTNNYLIVLSKNEGETNQQIAKILKNNVKVNIDIKLSEGTAKVQALDSNNNIVIDEKITSNKIIEKKLYKVTGDLKFIVTGDKAEGTVNILVVQK
jgi:hypothetical protein